MAKKATPKPESQHESEPDSMHDILRKLRHEIRHLTKELERLTMTAADQQTAIDALKAAVTKVAAEVAALKAAEPIITQAQLDANVADLQAATTTLEGL